MAGFFKSVSKIIGAIFNEPKPSSPEKNHDIHHAQSFSDSSVFYSIDADLLTCTCPDWSKRRSAFQKQDPRRLCKHLVQHVGRSKDPRLSVFLGVISKYMEMGWGVPFVKNIAIIENGNDPIGVLEPENNDDRPWYGISHNGDWYSYSRKFDKWEGGRTLPPPADAAFLRHIFGVATIVEQIQTTRRSTDQKDIPKDLIGSWGISESIFTNGGWVAIGTVVGVEVKAFINPRATWQCFMIGKDGIPYDVKNDDWRGPKKLLHIESIAKQWVANEYEACKSQKKAAKKQK